MTEFEARALPDGEGAGAAWPLCGLDEQEIIPIVRPKTRAIWIAGDFKILIPHRVDHSFLRAI